MGQSDRVYKALSERRRRVTLQYVREHRTLSLSDLAELVAEHEEGENVRELAEDVVSDVYASLYHVHVPLLADADLVQYDRERDVVAAPDRLESVLGSVAEELLELGATASPRTSS